MLFNWSSSSFLVVVFLVNTGIHCLEGIGCILILVKQNDNGKLLIYALFARFFFVVFLIPYILLNLDLFHPAHETKSKVDVGINTTSLMMAWITAEVVLFGMLALRVIFGRN